MKTQLENVRIVFNIAGDAVALIRKDIASDRTVVYVLTNATVTEVANLIDNKDTSTLID